MASTPEILPPATTILKKYYTVIQDLQSYLVGILEFPGQESSPENIILNETDSNTYVCLLKTSYIGMNEPRPKKFHRYAATPMLEMRDVLDQAQERLFKFKRPQNIITSGYRLASRPGDNGKKGMTRIGITNYFINTVVTAFQAPEWETLLLRVGEDAMIHLLTQTSIFVSLPNGCLCQLAGEPVIHLAPQVNIELPRSNGKRLLEENQDQTPKKRPKVDNSGLRATTGNKLPGKTLSPINISFIRVRLFYSRPNFIPRTNHIIVGFPLKHILNRIKPSYTQDSKLKEASSETQKARHLSKYVFARQYGLNTPFHSSTGSVFNLGAYLDRELEIKAMGTCKTPKRLREILLLLETLIRRHAKCGYVPLRDIACPSKVKATGTQELDSSIILELMSETSLQLRSQVSLGGGNTSVDSTGNPIRPYGLTQAQKHAKQKPRFIEFACSHVEVYRYVALVTNIVIPKSFWGSKSNLKVVLNSVKEFISCRRYESLTLHHIMQKFSTTACDWLSPPGSGAHHQARVSVSDSLKRRELLEDFLFWYFDAFVLELLRTTFYVTESSAFRNQILYFRHDDWTTLCAPLIERLTTVTFEELSDGEAAQILRQRKLGFSFVRLLPKETGVRPIVNLRKKRANTGSYTHEQSINQILQAAFSILTYERYNQPERLGASIFGPDDMYFKLKAFKAALPRGADGSLPKLYFVKLDVQACFDTIDQTKLLQILRELISEDVYMMQKYGQIKISADKVKRTYVKKAVPEDDHPHFLRYAADLAGVLRNIIFVDQVVYPLSRKQEVLQLLEEHITENIVKIGQKYYRQTVGIPQGSVLSSILCSFFYGDLETKFARYMEDPQSVLLRLTDDYLFITTSLSNAVGFLDIMKKGHPEYGCFIAQDKTLTNFDYGENVLNVVDQNQRMFPWCGYSINMRDLSITVDYTRYHGPGIRSTLTVDRGRRPGANFTFKLLQLARAKSHAIFSDRDLNTEDVVYLNIYQNLLLAAMKMHEYIREWRPSGKRNTRFLRNVIQRTIAYNYTVVLVQARRKGARPEIRKDSVIWLGNHAFRHVLSQIPQKYQSLVIGLDFDMRRVKHRHHHRRFRALVKEGQTGLAHIPR